ncbi:MAG: tetratricopeptide repeat protein [Pseudomonadota bacterium]
MANEYLDDYEQAEAVKQWVRDNGGAILMGVALAIGGLFGFRYWQDFQTSQRVAAARSYVDLAAALDRGENAPEALQQFETAHDGSAFVGFAALSLAKAANDAGNLDEAAQYLRRATEIAQPEALRSVAGLRLARVQLAQGEHAAALATVDRFGSGAFEGLAAELRGDILLAQGDRAGAREAYEVALNELDSGGDRNLLQMKYDDLADVGDGGGST